MKRDTIEILSRAPSDPERRKLTRELGTEFQQIYAEYRRKFHPFYQCTSTQSHLAERAAVLCAEFGISPSEYIAFWAEHVGDFTNMYIPSLNFLSGPANVDRAACVLGPVYDDTREETELDDVE